MYVSHMNSRVTYFDNFFALNEKRCCITVASAHTNYLIDLLKSVASLKRGVNYSPARFEVKQYFQKMLSISKCESVAESRVTAAFRWTSVAALSDNVGAYYRDASQGVNSRFEYFLQAEKRRLTAPLLLLMSVHNF